MIHPFARCVSKLAFVIPVLVACQIPPGHTYDGHNPAATKVSTQYGPNSYQMMDTYTAGVQTAGTVLFVHGGAWSAGSRAELPATLLSLVEYGWKVASIDYALSCTDPSILACRGAKLEDELADVYLAAKVLGPTIVAGFSAGGHLANLVALTNHFDRSTGTAAVFEGYVNLNGPTDFAAALADDRPVFFGFSIGSFARTVNGPLSPELYSPVTYLQQWSVPGFVVHGVDDTVIPVATQHEPYIAKAEGFSTYLVAHQVAGEAHAINGVNYQQLVTWVTVVHQQFIANYNLPDVS